MELLQGLFTLSQYCIGSEILAPACRDFRTFVYVCTVFLAIVPIAVIFQESRRYREKQRCAKSRPAVAQPTVIDRASSEDELATVIAHAIAAFKASNPEKR